MPCNTKKILQVFLIFGHEFIGANLPNLHRAINYRKQQQMELGGFLFDSNVFPMASVSLDKAMLYLPCGCVATFAIYLCSNSSLENVKLFPPKMGFGIQQHTCIAVNGTWNKWEMGWFVNTDKVININAGALSYSFPVLEGIQAVNPRVMRLWHQKKKWRDIKRKEWFRRSKWEEEVPPVCHDCQCIESMNYSTYTSFHPSHFCILISFLSNWTITIITYIDCQIIMKYESFILKVEGLL